MKPKKDIIWPHLNNSGGNINKDWYVEFSLRNPDTGKMERKRIYDGFKDLTSYEQKMDLANNLIKDYTERIRCGQISTQKMIEFEDELMFDTNTYKSRRRLGKENTFKVLASEFVQYKRSEVSGKSMQSYKSKLRAFENYLEIRGISEKQINLIDNKLIINFLKNLVDENDLSKLTIEKYQQILYSFFVYIAGVKKINMSNPVLNIPRIGRVVDESAPSLPPEIRKRLQNKIKREDPQLWLACCMQYYCAIRPGTELRLMKLKQINYQVRTITVRNFLAKNSRTEVVDIPEQLYRMIDDWDLESYDQELYLFGDNGEPGTKPLGKNAMRYRFNKIRDSLGLSKEIKYYSWKHSGALELKNSGANMYDIQRHFRHKSVTTTEGYWRKRLGGTGDKIKNNFPDI